MASFPLVIGDLVDAKNLPQFNNFIEKTDVGEIVERAYLNMRGWAEYSIGFFAPFLSSIPFL